METFYDGYVVNAIVDASYRSAASHGWEPVELEWRGGAAETAAPERAEEAGRYRLVKEETLPDGRVKRILRDRETGEIVEEEG
jgi:hypothetical protein